MASAAGAAVIALALGGATAAQAQGMRAAAPPVRGSVDGNGVDLVSGALVVADNDVAIGPGDGTGMTYSRAFNGTGWRDNLVGTLNSSGSTYTVSFGGSSESFTLAGGVYTQAQGGGSTLTFDAGTQRYTYTSARGQVVVFDRALAGTVPYQANEGRVVSVMYPNRLSVTYAYRSVNLCTSPGVGCANYTRLQSATSSVGYQVKLEYSQNNPATAADAAAFNLVTRVLGINNAVEYCNPTADSCGQLNVAWPQATYATALDNPNARTTTDSMGRVVRYTYDGAGHIIGIRRPSAAADSVTIGYDGSGRVSAVSNGAGAWAYAYVDAGGIRTTTVTDPLSHTRVLRSDLATSLVTSDTDGLGYVTSYTYDPAGRLTRVTLPEGNHADTDYDARGNVTRVTQSPKPGGAGSISVTAVYPPGPCANPVTCNLPTSTTDAAGQTTTYAYDEVHGGVRNVARPDPGNGVRPQTTYGYTALSAWYRNAGGALVAGPAVYRLTSVSACATGANCTGAANEVVTSITYGVQGAANNLAPTAVSGGSGDGLLTATTTATYDAVGNVLTVDGPLPGAADTTRYTWDPDREVTRVEGPDPDGAGPRHLRGVRLTYNSDGQTTLAEQGDLAVSGNWGTFAVARQQVTAYDPQGRRIRDDVQAGGVTYAVTQYSYDAAGRPDCAVIRMNPAAFGALPSACFLGAPGAYGPDRITRNAYNNADQVTSVTAAYGTAEAATVAAASYTANGLQATLSDARGYVTTYEYDAFDRPLKVRYPLPGNPGASSNTDYEQSTWDAAGRLSALRRRDGVSIYYAYDNLGWGTTLDLPPGQNDVAYTWDNLDRQLTAAAGGQTITFGWDALGRNTSQADSLTGTLSYAYDLAGRRTRITWPDAFYVTYDYDVTGAMTAVRENGAVAGPGVLAAFTYDTLGRRTGLTRAGGAGASTTYAWDAVGRLSGITQDFAGPASDVTLGFTYSPAGQILTRTVSNSAYVFHPAGPASTSYVSNGLNQYTSVAGTGFTHDARGNLTSDGTRTFTYDALNRLTGVTGQVSLAYDPLGRLGSSTVDGAATRFQYDGD